MSAQASQLKSLGRARDLPLDRARRAWLDTGHRVCGVRDIASCGIMQRTIAAAAKWLTMRPGLSLSGEFFRPDPRTALYACEASLPDGSSGWLVIGVKYGQCVYAAEVRA